MKIEDLEEVLRKAKNPHLTDDVLVSYRDQELDEISRAQAWAHLDRCLICERRLLLLRKEREETDAPGELTGEELASIKRAARKTMSEAAKTASGVPLTDRLAEYLQQAVANWGKYIERYVAVRGSERSSECMFSIDINMEAMADLADTDGIEIWRWESGDGVLTAYVVQELNGDLTVNISSSEPGLENVRLKVSLGTFGQEATLIRVSESEVRAEVSIPRRQQPRNLSYLSIERL